jgi:dihydropteroate synthase
MTPKAFDLWLTDAHRPTLVMGVLNVTPDSFSDGGQHLVTAVAVDFAKQMIDEGADLIDIGGESTRPGSQRTPAEEQIRRIAPVIEAVAKLGTTISVDTTRTDVAAAALDAGASIVNDISAGTDEPAMAAFVAARRCPVILMHMQGEPGTMQANPTYTDVVGEVRDYLAERIGAFEAAGVARERILVDPGIGFGKTLEHNLALLANMDALSTLGRPIVMGTSRKGFIGKLLNQPIASERVFGTAATIAWSVANGAGIVRVHDVGPMKQVTQIISAILRSRGSAGR